jgi:glycosyltransferase involved in cell wall biosynthesis
MELANILIPFSEYSWHEAHENAGISAGHMKVVYLGVPDSFISLPVGIKEKMVLTVGKMEWSNLKRKGIEPFVRIAAKLLDVKFVVVGEWVDDSIEYLRSIATSNVVFVGRIGDQELMDYYRRASVYVQASLHEGFGLSVAEAMLAGCVPVVTNVGSLPEVVGDCGFYCNLDDLKNMVDSIRSALDYSFADRHRIRERILTMFPVDKRKELIQQIVYALWENSVGPNSR